MEYQSLVELLDGFWSTPWSELPLKQREAWYLCAYLNVAPRQAGPCEKGTPEMFPQFDWGEYGEMGADFRKSVAEQYDQHNDPANKAENTIAWLDETMQAADWFRRKNIKPGDAAKLLGGISPTTKDDPKDDESSPARYSLLKGAFNDEAEASQESRTLLDWLKIATDRKLHIHSWIDRYLNACSKIGIDMSSTEKSSSGTLDSAGMVRRKRAALVSELVSIWPTIELDLSDSGRNGLNCAKLEKHGFWDLTKAVEWAVEREKITKQKARQSIATNHDSVFAATLKQLFNM